METKYQTEKKEKEITMLKKEKEIQLLKLNRSRFITGAITSIFILILVIAILLIRQYRQRVHHSATELKQKLLRTQMNPHFIFNSLIAIQSYMYKNKPEDAGKYLSSFAKLTRLILENSNYEYVALEKEIATLNYYMELQELRFENKFKYCIEIDPRINTETMAVPPMLAQPFIENAIEHGLKNNSDKGNILIKYQKADDFILFEVEDNGCGLKLNKIYGEEKKRQDRPHAISITQERLSNLNRKKKQKITLNITNINDLSGNISGTKVLFYIPYKYID
ncbi:MAG: histidine kinase [Bacteroidia bacterium]|nr:histidine kinase [Bacteroidia bacterium]